LLVENTGCFSLIAIDNQGLTGPLKIRVSIFVESLRYQPAKYFRKIRIFFLNSKSIRFRNARINKWGTEFRLQCI